MYSIFTETTFRNTSGKSLHLYAQKQAS